MRAMITIDVRAANSGLGTYIRHLAKNLSIPRTYISRPDQGAEYPGVVSTAKIYSVKEQWEIPRLCKTSALHVPHYNAPVAFRGTLIVTIHDVIHLQHPAHRWKSLVYAWPLLLAVSRRADRLITVSELSKRAIVEYLRIAEDRITVIHNGVDPQTPALSDRDDYLLYVGNLKPSKNLATLIKAMELLPGRRLKVIGAGKPPSATPPNVEFLGFVDDLAPFYRKAAATVLPSTHEGFCLPVLESLSYGCPVVCSDILHEIGGPYAEYFNPLSPDDIVRAIGRARYDPQTPTWLSRFSWTANARTHEQVYAELGIPSHS